MMPRRGALSRRGQPGPLARPHQGARFPARLPLSPNLKTPTLGLPFGCPFGPYQSSIALGPRRWLAHPRARRSFVVGARPAAPGNTGHPRRGLVTPARPRNRRLCVPFRSPTLQSHHLFLVEAKRRTSTPKRKTWQPWHEQRDQSRGPPPDATVRRLRAGAHAASSLITPQDRARYKTRADARENGMRRTTRRARAAATRWRSAPRDPLAPPRRGRARTTPGPARPAAPPPRRTPARPRDPRERPPPRERRRRHTHTRPPTGARAGRSTRRARRTARACSTASRATASAPCCARRRPRRAPRP